MKHENILKLDGKTVALTFSVTNGGFPITGDGQIKVTKPSEDTPNAQPVVAITASFVMADGAPMKLELRVVGGNLKKLLTDDAEDRPLTFHSSGLLLHRPPV